MSDGLAYVREFNALLRERDESDGGGGWVTQTTQGGVRTGKWHGLAM